MIDLIFQIILLQQQIALQAITADIAVQAQINFMRSAIQQQENERLNEQVGKMCPSNFTTPPA